MSFYRESTHISRKTRRCDGCRQTISPGEQYLSLVGMNSDGDFCTSTYHADCRAVEVELCRYCDLGVDELTFLHEHVEEGGVGVLDDAPETVRARFAPVIA